MKKLNSLVFLCLISISCFTQITITGSLKGYDSPSIFFQTNKPLRLETNWDSIQLQSDAFQIKLVDIDISFVSIRFKPDQFLKYSHFVNLFVEKNDSIHIKLDFDFFSESAKDYSLKISGSNSPGLQLFHSFKAIPSYNHVEELLTELKKTSSDRKFQQIYSHLKEQIQPFEQLLKNGQISPKFFQKTSRDIQLSLLNTIFSQLEKENEDSDDKNQLIRHLFDYLPPNENLDHRSSSGQRYLFAYLKQELLKKEGVNDFSQISDTIVKVNEKEWRIDKGFRPILAVDNPNILEHLYAQKINSFYGMLIVESIDDWVGDAFDHFKHLYPKSKYIPIIEQTRLKTIQKAISAASKKHNNSSGLNRLKTGIPIVVDDRNKMKDFQFKNKIVDFSKGIYYVNIWSTNCHSCIQEMRYKPHTDSLLETNNIDQLYISVDNLENKNKWLSKIYDYQLVGYHVFAGRYLKKVLNANLDIEESALEKVPFLLIKEGEIQFSANSYRNRLTDLELQINKLRGK